MKLQYRGDYRDAFKYDFLHWLCSRSDPPFASLIIVPLLTPDDPNLKDGKIVHTRFAARPEIQKFVVGLKDNSSGLYAVTRLGDVDRGHRFQVLLHAPGRHIESGCARDAYWSGLEPQIHGNSILFLDPDNGFETKTQKGPKWVLHGEVKWLLKRLPESSAVVVYQHRPQRSAWTAVFRELRPRLNYVPFLCAAYDSTLAIIILTRSTRVFGRLAGAAKCYAERPQLNRSVRLATYIHTSRYGKGGYLEHK